VKKIASETMNFVIMALEKGEYVSIGSYVAC